MNNENKDILVTLCSYIKNNERCGEFLFTFTY